MLLGEVPVCARWRLQAKGASVWFGEVQVSGISLCVLIQIAVNRNCRTVSKSKNEGVDTYGL